MDTSNTVVILEAKIEELRFQVTKLQAERVTRQKVIEEFFENSLMKGLLPLALKHIPKEGGDADSRAQLMRFMLGIVTAGLELGLSSAALTLPEQN